MSDIDIQNVLAQMRTMALKAQGIENATTESVAQQDFSKLLKDSIDAVNATQKKAGSLSEAFVTGQPGVDLAQVMVALQKANVSFQAMTQVRNKLVDAYHEIMRINI